MRNLGSLHQFLGITAEQTPSGLLLHQTKYAESILERAGMTNCKPLASPAHPKHNNSIETKSFSNPTLYRQLVGALQYLTLTRPDIAFAVNRASQAMHNPTEHQFSVLKRILRYIRGTIRHGLPLSDNSLTLTSYSDSDWAGDQQDRKSTT
ncbi:hypothetical protein KFK09_023128 [Dendrobium nobile]|uniref:Mitochondrial protein n=1 Tax=Dendrobium nobile TaxID=94219 RepID=A0A8T3AL89_DENNO|nr:hypothetical protein KFK09_023128 [Dendrobium nobile]